MSQEKPKVTDDLTFAPPDDNHFQLLLSRALKGQLPVYGVVLQTSQISLRRSYPMHRPELTRHGAEVIAAMAVAWQDGTPVQPWLYVSGDDYVVADDYFWLALIEKYGVETFAAQVIGEPLSTGLLQKVGPLSNAQVRGFLGLSDG
jgi:hypothetical protein